MSSVIASVIGVVIGVVFITACLEVSMTRTDRLLAELNNDRRINKQLKMANALLRKSEAAKIERIEELEELARDLHADLMEYGCTPNAHRANYKPRFEALGIEVGE